MTAKLVFVVFIHCVLVRNQPHAATTEPPTSNGGRAKILILGAGLAGIRAGKLLTQKNVTDFLILEGSNRVGGRMKNVNLGGYTIEVGAQWFYGGGEDDPIMKICKENNITFVESDYDDYVTLNMTGGNTTSIADERYRTFQPALDKTLDFAKQYEERKREVYWRDTSGRSQLKKYGWDPEGPLDYAIEYWDVEFEYGQPAEQVSAIHMDLPSYTDKPQEQYFITDQNGGYVRVIESLRKDYMSANDPRLVLNSKVVKITHNENGVVVQTSDGRLYMGEQVIVTFSLGVLQKTAATLFEPKLPEWKMDSINQMGFALYTTITVKFASNITKFWSSKEWTLIANDRRGEFPLIQDLEKHFPGSRMLQLTITGDEARRMEAKSDDEVKEEVQKYLSRIYGTVPSIMEIYIPRWHKDPLYFGSFSGFPIAYSNGSFRALKSSLGRVHFAGESYEEKWVGYPNGAFHSVEKLVDEIAECLKNSTTCDRFKPRVTGCTRKDAPNFEERAIFDDGSCNAAGRRTPAIFQFAAFAILITSFFLKDPFA